MTITYHPDLIQGSDEWLQQRCGMLTASNMHLILTPTLRAAENDPSRAHLWTLLAQRITGHVDPQYVSDAMLRGHDDEIEARALYEQHYAPVQQIGFVTNDQWGFTIGYSPDGLVGDDGLIECKSRGNKFQVRTIIEDKVPDEYMIQLQTGLLVTQRKWIDFISYSGGLPLFVKRVLPIPEYQDAITEASQRFSALLLSYSMYYREKLEEMPKLIPTDRRVEQEMVI